MRTKTLQEWLQSGIDNKSTNCYAKLVNNFDDVISKKYKKTGFVKFVDLVNFLREASISWDEQIEKSDKSE